MYENTHGTLRRAATAGRSDEESRNWLRDRERDNTPLPPVRRLTERRGSLPDSRDVSDAGKRDRTSARLPSKSALDP